MNRTSQVIRAITERVRMSVGDDASRRRMMFAVVNVALCTVSLFMSVINIFTAESLLIFSTLAFCALCAFNLFMLHIYRSSAMPIYILFTVESTGTYSYLLHKRAAQRLQHAVGLSYTFLCPACFRLKVRQRFFRLYSCHDNISLLDAYGQGTAVV